jgi:hypothetical protein
VIRRGANSCTIRITPNTLMSNIALTSSISMSVAGTEYPVHQV